MSSLIFNFNGTRYEGRPDIVKDIEGLVATCEALGPDPKYAELEKAKAETFKPAHKYDRHAELERAEAAMPPHKLKKPKKK